ncbi:Uncharacterized protein DAT39_000304 [Clarias magur]|uniref:Uncharacterized protein n=1 Tax=Clarias magur TaxID=1594786 RepID=A0A8J4XL85_CLAMG|nr:Uncharacterized protein DAT39_000304 [Clarias magur]
MATVPSLGNKDQQDALLKRSSFRKIEISEIKRLELSLSKADQAVSLTGCVKDSGGGGHTCVIVWGLEHSR